MSLSGGGGGGAPLFPLLLPRVVDPLWHLVDVPRDEDAEIQALEREQRARWMAVAKTFSDAVPVGKATQVRRNTKINQGTIRGQIYKFLAELCLLACLFVLTGSSQGSQLFT